MWPSLLCWDVFRGTQLNASKNPFQNPFYDRKLLREPFLAFRKAFGNCFSILFLAHRTKHLLRDDSLSYQTNICPVIDSLLDQQGQHEKSKKGGKKNMSPQMARFCCVSSFSKCWMFTSSPPAPTTLMALLWPCDT